MPLASVTLNAFVVVPIGNKLPLIKPEVWVIICPIQLSVELLLYVTTAPETPGSLETVIGALHVIVGNSLSVTVTVNEHVAVLLLASVTLKVFVVVPIGNKLPLAKPAVCVISCPVQLSVELLL